MDVSFGAQVAIHVYEHVAEVEEGTASVAVDVLNIFGGHEGLCVVVPSFVVSLGQVMECRRNPLLMWKKIFVHWNDEHLLGDPCFNITRADAKKGRWVERQEAPILSLVHTFWPEDQAVVHKLLNSEVVELATNFFQLIIKAFPI
jgi:hypothetical protein